MKYVELDDKTLDKLHKVGLEILLEIDRVCKKYDINYFLCGGTLLGSIRHKGFIPWDDDIDLGMLRDDYEKFKICFTKEHSNDYFLHCYDTDKKYCYPYIKVRKNNTTMDENFTKNLDFHKGIFVDIFPFDKVPDNGFNTLLKLRSFFIKLIVEAVFCKQGVYTYKDTRRPILTKLMLIFNVNTLFKIQNKLMIKYNSKNVNHCICYVGSYKTSIEYIGLDNILPTKEGLFEKHNFSVPNKSEVYLTNLYGDYMKLPPKDKRKNHNAMMIDFNNGDCIINEELK